MNEHKATVTFNYVDTDGLQVTLTVDATEKTHIELTEQYENFLRAIGYIIRWEG